ncbi:SLC13 family permease [Neptunomonas marina]|uniref:SLC13 family permease n=1 Tax=Neptunomonas marina TaxID=1815562 RepID=A0A437QAR0_9GAMM|nr:SLC13 family permease [Neptunomonas marina]RVU31610.1 SLC13 family permease [Neptunomonas marina]
MSTRKPGVLSALGPLSVAHWASIIIVSGALLLGYIAPAGLTTQQSWSAALVVAALGLMATAVVADYLIALLFFLAAMLFAIAPAEVVFAGFSAGATWLIISGFVIGMAVKSTGLGQRLSGYLMVFASSYTRLTSAVVVLGVGLAFLMPSSMGRIVLLMPIVLLLAERCGLKPGSQGYVGMALAAGFGAHVPSFAVLPANVPNMVLVGVADTVHGLTLGYAEYLWLHFPVLGVLKAVLIIWLIIKMFPAGSLVATQSEIKPLQRTEIYLLGLLLVALGFWLTDSVHQLSPAWVALTVAVILLLPRIGLVSKQQFSEQFNFNTVLFIAAILGIGAVINHSSLGAWFAHLLAPVLPLAPNEPLQNYLSLSLLSMSSGVVAGLPGIPAVLTPVAAEFAQASGLPLKAVLMSQVVGISTFLFPYESGPLLLALSMANVPMRLALKYTLVLAAMSVVLLWPLNYLWWLLLGWL